MVKLVFDKVLIIVGSDDFIAYDFETNAHKSGHEE